MADLPAWAAGYVGLPYRVGGRERDGLDCWGLVRLVWREEFGLAVPEHAGVEWGCEAATASVSAYIAQEAAGAGYWPVAAGQEREGDAILLRVRGLPLHVGVVLTPGIMLHVAEGADAVVEGYHSMAWSRRVLGFYRPKGIA